MNVPYVKKVVKYSWWSKMAVMIGQWQNFNNIKVNLVLVRSEADEVTQIDMNSH